jgi:hypothetical protein
LLYSIRQGVAFPAVDDKIGTSLCTSQAKMSVNHGAK